MEWFEALILGIIQGLTEYLPVSSSGHLTIGAELFRINNAENLTFTIVVHAATVLSTIIVLWKDIVKLLEGLFKFKWNEETQYLTKILVSMIPIAIVGFCFKDQVEEIFEGGLLLVGCMLLITAALLMFSYYAKPRQKDSISFKDALIIGISQACAIFPGLSRSGTTISTGLLLGIKKEKVAQFSFLMVIVPILGETLLDLFKGEFSASSSNIPTLSLVIGFLAAFISGAIACKWMLNVVKKGKLVYFAYYCILVGVIAIISSFLK
jgi:Uncharacterized bacitracin resistance protein